MGVNLQAVLVFADTWGWHHGEMDGGWWIVMIFGMVLFWAVVIAAAVWLVRGGLGGGERRDKEADPLRILERRLANGEISVEEYETRRRVLIGK